VNRGSHTHRIVSCMLLALTGMVGCRNEVQEAPTASDEPQVERDGTIRVAPQLLTSGRITVAEVVAFTHSGTIRIPGDVMPAPDGEAEVGSLVAGRLATLESVEGDRVTKGQVLAWIDSPEIGSVRADLARAKSQVTAANKRLERQLSLQSQGATSQVAVDEARTAVSSAEADIEAARAILSASGVHASGSGGRLAVRAPIDGVIVARLTTLGRAVGADTTLFRIINPDSLRVHAQWSEAMGAVPSVGNAVDVIPRSRSGGSVTATTCAGTVSAHLGVIDRDTRSTTLQVTFSSPCPTLMAGAYVDVLVARRTTTIPADNWTQVPLESVVDLRGLPTVFVAGKEQGDFEARQVVPGASIGNVIPIEHGLRPGEAVATAGLTLLKGEALRDILGAD
jgi:membrane fusion protein, heavy metal efflux system